MRRALSAAVTVVLLALVAGWSVWLRPPALGGGTSFIVVSGQSMEPTLSSGDLAVIRAQTSYAIGDIIAFYPSPPDSPRAPVVIHRIVDGTAQEGFKLAGDSNGWVDPWTPTQELVAGRLWLLIPGGGRHLLLVNQPAVLAALAAGLTALLVLTGSERRRGRHAAPPDWRFGFLELFNPRRPRGRHAAPSSWERWAAAAFRLRTEAT